MAQASIESAVLAPDQILSAEFQASLEEFEKGDVKRILLLHRASYSFYFHFEQTNSLQSLDRAISFGEKAIRELPEPHDLGAALAEELTIMLQHKASITMAVEDVEAYIQAVRRKMDLAGAPNSDQDLCELGCAQYQRYLLTGDNVHLNEAIENLQNYISSVETAVPEGAIAFGQALHRRYAIKSHVEDLDNATNMLKIGLAQIDADDPTHLVAMVELVECCKARYARQNDFKDLDDLIRNAERALAYFSADTSEHDWLRDELINAHMIRYFQRPHSMSEVQADSGFLDEGLCASKLSTTTSPANVSTVMTSQLESLQMGDGAYSSVQLCTNKREIRLIELHPGTTDDDVNCTLLVASLDRALEYEALSYVWGNPKETKTIYVNGIIQNVTNNLHSALLQLRSPTSSRKLWVDAICIDQRNLDEKQQQIALMRDIYTKAKYVAIWLGNPKRNAAVPFAPSESVAATWSHLEEVWQSYQQSLKDCQTSEAGGSQKDQSLNNATQRMDPKAAVPLKRFAHIPDAREALDHLPDEVRPMLYLPTKADQEESLRNARPFVVDLIRTTEAINVVTRHKELISRNARAKALQGPRLHRFDWSSTENIHHFFQGPLGALEWPILGAFSLIYSLAKGDHFSELPFFQKDQEIAYNGSQAWMKSASVLLEILDLSYWKRAWIVQEIVLGHKPMLYYGAHVMPLNALIRARHNFQVHYGNCCKHEAWSQNAQQADSTWWTKIRVAFYRIEEIAELRVAHTAAREAGNRLSLDLIDILRTGIGEREATDPRDLIYGILGLVPNEGGQKIVADYSLSTAQVFARTAAKIILDQECLVLFVCNELGRHEALGLPSWTPDWTSRRTFMPHPYLYHLFRASMDRKCMAEVQGDLCLSIRSIFVDKICKIGPMESLNQRLFTDSIPYIKAWRELAELPETETVNTEGYDPREEEFWRTVFADVLIEDRKSNLKSNNFRRFRPGDVTRILHWWKWLQIEQPRMEGYGTDVTSSKWLANGPLDIMHRFSRAMLSRRFFVTQEGRMGTGPGSRDAQTYAEIEEGDEIHIAPGCNLPLVLRPIKHPQPHGKKPNKSVAFRAAGEGDAVGRPATVVDQREVLPHSTSAGKAPFSAPVSGCNHTQEKVYQLIGTCYVYGIMDGEGLRASPVEPTKVYLH